MNQSQEIDKLAGALCAAQASLNAAVKDSLNPHFRSQYASLQSVWAAAREVLAPNGLSVVQTFQPTDGHRLDLTTTLLHSSGQWMCGTISLVPQKSDPQGIGSAATYARRYGLSAILGIVADDDDDGNNASLPRQVDQRPANPKATPSPAKAPDATTAPKPTPTPTPATKPAESAPKTPAAGPVGDWRESVIHFGKKKGVALGELEEQSLLWYIEKWEPKDKPGYPITSADVALRKALDLAGASMALPGFGVPQQEDVPYDNQGL